MLKVKSVMCVGVLVCLTALTTHAETVTCPVNVDTYLVPMGPCGSGYPINYAVKSMEDWLTIPALVGFDLANLAGYTESDVISADFKFYRLDSPGGRMNPATAPAGTSFSATIHALDNTVPLTEALAPGENPGNCTAHGVIDRCIRPGVLGPGYSASNDTGPNTWAEADITQIVKDWLDGTCVNNGIEFQDDTGPVGADPLNPDNYVWYWASLHNTVSPGCIDGAGNPLHPGAQYSPYLEVDVVPEPSTIALLCSGGLALLWLAFRRRRRLRGA